MIRVILPAHLMTLAKVRGEVELSIDRPVTIRALLEVLEEKFPVLRGTIRDHGTLKRRPMLRYFACEEDYSHRPVETVLPEEISSGKEPFMVVGAIAGG